MMKFIAFAMVILLAPGALGEESLTRSYLSRQLLRQTSSEEVREIIMSIEQLEQKLLAKPGEPDAVLEKRILELSDHYARLPSSDRITMASSYLLDNPAINELGQVCCRVLISDASLGQNEVILLASVLCSIEDSSDLKSRPRFWLNAPTMRGKLAALIANALGFKNLPNDGPIAVEAAVTNPRLWLSQILNELTKRQISEKERSLAELLILLADPKSPSRLRNK